jgi:hypothetical protein
VSSDSKYPRGFQSSSDDCCGNCATDDLRRRADVLLTLGSGRVIYECLKEIRDGADIVDVAERYGRLLPLAAYIERNAASNFTFRHLTVAGVSC